MGSISKGFCPLKISITEYPNFSDRLKIAMQLRDCTVDELATAICVTKSAICGYRAGYRSPDIDTLRLMAQTLEVSADFLIGLREDFYA